MTNFTRRSFLALSASAALAPRLRAAAPLDAYAMVAEQDRARITRLAAQWLSAKPQTVTSFHSPKSPGGPHDFFSEADYFWPNPDNPNGPYKEIDGKSNPDNFQLHRKAMLRLSQAVPVLTAMYSLAHKRLYARAAAAHLRAWFVTPATRMTPNLEFAQGYHGGPAGRSYGIIDTLHLVEVVRAAGYLKEFFSFEDFNALQMWFRHYLDWLTTSDKGIKERDATNNHGICWALQASEFARFLGDEDRRDKVRETFFNIQLPNQMAPNGSFPRETARTKPYGYSIFTFDCAAALCWSLSAPDSNAEYVRRSLPDGRGMGKAAEFLFPYLEDKEKWPFPHDVQHWESWPVRSPGLLFTGLACAKSDYVALWRRLDPDPIDPEVIRNFPIRQPLLWMS